MPWLSQVKGVLEAWYPGPGGRQRDRGAAVRRRQPVRQAAGDVPARRRATCPTRTRAQYPGVNEQRRRTHYSEGLLVGYRWYDAKHITPLFPFGFGLSYTTLRATRPAPRRPPASGARDRQRSTSRTPAARRRRGRAAVRRLVPRRGDEPPKQLKGYQKVLARRRGATQGQAGARLPLAGSLERLRAPLEGRLGLLSRAGRGLVKQPAAVGDDRRRRRALQGREGARDRCDAASRSTRSLHLS